MLTCRFWLFAVTALCFLSNGCKKTSPVANQPEAATVFAATGRGLYRSLDDGTSWTRLTNGLVDSSIQAIAMNSVGHLFVSTDSGLFRSTDNGDTWTLRSAQLSGFRGLEVGQGPFMYAITSNFLLYKSSDLGLTWSGDSTITSLALCLAMDPTDNIFLGTSSGLYKSIDNGSSWSGVALADTTIESVTIAPNGHIFIGTLGAIYRSGDGGNTWQASYPTVRGDEGFRSMTTDRNNLIYGIGNYTYSVFRSTNDGLVWTQHTVVNQYIPAFSICTSPNGLIFVGKNNGLVYRSSDQAISWQLSNTGMPSATNVHSLIAK